MAANTTGISEIEPMAFINGALQFSWGADELHKLVKPGGSDRHVGPVYLLLAHAIELALKGYLRLRGLSTATLAKRPYGHDLSELYKKCELLGLNCPTDKRPAIMSVIELLNDSNRTQGLRYFTIESQLFPELTWGVRAVQDLVTLAKDAALLADPDANKPGPAVKFDFTVTKPHG